MKMNQQLLNRIHKIGLILIMGISMSACSKSWEEEVLLHDGSKIIVQRSVERGGRHEIGQQPPIKEQILSFILPTTKEGINWKSVFSEDVGLADFQPLLIDIFQGAAYVVSHPVGCLAYNKWGRPNPPYVIFKYQNKAWNRITLQDLPAEIKTPNIIFGSPDNNVEKLGTSFVSAEDVKKINSRLKQPEFKTILRETVKDADGRCGEMVYDGKGGWVGIGWFNEKPSHGACMDECKRRKIETQYCPCKNLFKEEK